MELLRDNVKERIWSITHEQGMCNLKRGRTVVYDLEQKKRLNQKLNSGTLETTWRQCWRRHCLHNETLSL